MYHILSLWFLIIGCVVLLGAGYQMCVEDLEEEEEEE